VRDARVAYHVAGECTAPAKIAFWQALSAPGTNSRE
jgi:hypothetical protein